MTVINFKKKNNNWPTLVHTMAPHSINSLFYFIFVWSQHLTFPSYSRCFFNTSTKFHESNAQAFRVLIHRSEFKTILYPFHHLGFQNLMASGSQLEPRVLQIRFKFKLLTTKKKRKQVHESENIPKNTNKLYFPLEVSYSLETAFGTKPENQNIFNRT